MPPEVFRKDTYDYKFDVFSLGVILWTLLACDFPFNDDSVQGLSKKILECKPNWRTLQRKGVSDECIDLLSKMLAKEKRDRISLEEALAHPWFKKEENIKNNAVLSDNDKETALYSLTS